MSAEKPGVKKKTKDTVYELSRASRCHNCDAKLEAGQIVRLENRDDDREALCAKCSQLDKLVIVPSGNSNMTRLATKYSDICFSIMKWSELWKCYERRGIMVTAEAFQQAESELKSQKA